MIKILMRVHFIGISLFMNLYSLSVKGQLSIGKSSVDGDGIVDFGNFPKGIVLPIVNSLPNPPSPGTFVVDNNDNKVKVFSNGTWIYLTDVVGSTDRRIANLSSDIGEGVIIGNSESSAKGILVLESENKALILPKVANPHLNIPNPVIGTICYDVVSKSLAIYDGNEWHYWK